MDQTLFQFELPKIFDDLFGSFSLPMGIILMLVGFLFLFFGPDARRASGPTKDDDDSGDDEGEEAPGKAARKSGRGDDQAKGGAGLSAAAFWFGLACLLFGVCVLAVNVLKSSDQDDAMNELMSARAELSVGGGQEDRFVEIMRDNEGGERTNLLASLYSNVLQRGTYDGTVADRVATSVHEKVKAFADAELAGTSGPETEEALRQGYRELFDAGTVNMENLPLAPVKVPNYGVMVMFGFIAAIVIGVFAARQYGIDPNYIIDLGILAMIFGIAGARLWFVVQYWDQPLTDGKTFADDIMRVFAIQEGGLVFYGGFLLAAIVCILYMRLRKLPVLHMLDFLALTVPLGQAFGRIGCFLNGCCFGEACAFNHPLAVAFPDAKGFALDDGTRVFVANAGQTVYASQLLASWFGFLIFFFCSYYLVKIARRRGETFFIVIVLYGLSRFVEERFRQDTPGYLGGGEIINVIMLAALVLVPFLIVWFLVRDSKLSTGDRVLALFSIVSPVWVITLIRGLMLRGRDREAGNTMLKAVVVVAVFSVWLGLYFGGAVRPEPSIAQWSGFLAVICGVPLVYFMRYKSHQRPAHLAGFDELPVKYRRPAWASALLREAKKHEEAMARERASLAET